MKLSLLAVFALVTACPPPGPPAPVPPDATDGSPPPPTPVDASPAPAPVGDSGPIGACARACANLKALGCAEGSDAWKCYSTCEAVDGKIAALHPECVAAASSPAAVRVCGPSWTTACQP